ncbi:YdeI family protein [Mucilaginibacter sp. L196]|uniref:YdeI/OmpD-associated family protein n=1 Tax=Mucilaginibacter sp. L196 TaxID=1641870 RepID=UPI00131DF715|nr:YdeI/OmpD-associated family protein [Mucilaginibacter sp. L196]
MEQYNVDVHDYIQKAAPFAKPILNHIREVVHSSSPLITETIKWGMPFFEYKGSICQMAAFKQHCAFGFWKASLLDDPQGLLKIGEAAAGSFGRINTIDDLPSDETIIHFVLQAIQNNESGKKAPVVKKATVEKKELVVPDYFEALLNEHPKAKETFEKFSYSHKKEYLEWIIEAKTDATRQKRLDTTIDWLIEGKSRMWKYK